MCLQNQEEVVETWEYWSLLYPDGVPHTFMPSEPSIDPSLVVGQRAQENITRRLEELRRVNAVKRDSSPIGETYI